MKRNFLFTQAPFKNAPSGGRFGKQGKSSFSVLPRPLAGAFYKYDPSLHVETSQENSAIDLEIQSTPKKSLFVPKHFYFPSEDQTVERWRCSNCGTNNEFDPTYAKPCTGCAAAQPLLTAGLSLSLSRNIWICVHCLGFNRLNPQLRRRCFWCKKRWIEAQFSDGVKQVVAEAALRADTWTCPRCAHSNPRLANQVGAVNRTSAGVRICQRCQHSISSLSDNDAMRRVERMDGDVGSSSPSSIELPSPETLRLVAEDWAAKNRPPPPLDPIDPSIIAAYRVERLLTAVQTRLNYAWLAAACRVLLGEISIEKKLARQDATRSIILAQPQWLSQIELLTTWGLLTPHDPGRHGAPRHYCRYNATMKNEKVMRVIFDSTALNRAQIEPPAIGNMKLDTLKRAVFGEPIFNETVQGSNIKCSFMESPPAVWAVSGDLRHYFYQLPLPDNLKADFVITYDGVNKFVPAAVPAGWKWSSWLAANMTVGVVLYREAGESRLGVHSIAQLRQTNPADLASSFDRNKCGRMVAKAHKTPDQRAEVMLLDESVPCAKDDVKSYRAVEEAAQSLNGKTPQHIPLFVRIVTHSRLPQKNIRASSYAHVGDVFCYVDNVIVVVRGLRRGFQWVRGHGNQRSRTKHKKKFGEMFRDAWYERLQRNARALNVRFKFLDRSTSRLPDENAVPGKINSMPVNQKAKVNGRGRKNKHSRDKLSNAQTYRQNEHADSQIVCECDRILHGEPYFEALGMGFGPRGIRMELSKAKAKQIDIAPLLAASVSYGQDLAATKPKAALEVQDSMGNVSLIALPQASDTIVPNISTPSSYNPCIVTPRYVVRAIGRVMWQQMMLWGTPRQELADLAEVRTFVWPSSSSSQHRQHAINHLYKMGLIDETETSEEQLQQGGGWDDPLVLPPVHVITLLRYCQIFNANPFRYPTFVNHDGNSSTGFEGEATEDGKISRGVDERLQQSYLHMVVHTAVCVNGSFFSVVKEIKELESDCSQRKESYHRNGDKLARTMMSLTLHHGCGSLLNGIHEQQYSAPFFTVKDFSEDALRSAADLPSQHSQTSGVCHVGCLLKASRVVSHKKESVHQEKGSLKQKAGKHQPRLNDRNNNRLAALCTIAAMTKGRGRPRKKGTDPFQGHQLVRLRFRIRINRPRQDSETCRPLSTENNTSNDIVAPSEEARSTYLTTQTATIAIQTVVNTFLHDMRQQLQQTEERVAIRRNGAKKTKKKETETMNMKVVCRRPINLCITTNDEQCWLLFEEERLRCQQRQQQQAEDDDTGVIDVYDGNMESDPVLAGLKQKTVSNSVSTELQKTVQDIFRSLDEVQLKHTYEPISATEKKGQQRTPAVRLKVLLSPSLTTEPMNARSCPASMGSNRVGNPSLPPPYGAYSHLDFAATRQHHPIIEYLLLRNKKQKQDQGGDSTSISSLLQDSDQVSGASSDHDALQTAIKRYEKLQRCNIASEALSYWLSVAEKANTRSAYAKAKQTRNTGKRGPKITFKQSSKFTAENAVGCITTMLDIRNGQRDVHGIQVLERLRSADENERDDELCCVSATVPLRL